VILDVRTPEEYGRFCIPGGLNVPGGDLVLWAEALKRTPQRKVIVNCAGRTRSIIGTAALKRLGLPNVLELRNGTMGWVLAGFELESQPNRAGPLPPAESRARATGLAMRIAEEERIPWISPETVRAAGAGSDGAAVYLIDVRSEIEYESGHIAGSISVPGGQAVQRADDVVAVRTGTVVFCCDGTVRASVTASWYRQMGFANVYAVAGGTTAWAAAGRPLVWGAEDLLEPLVVEARARVPAISPAELAARLDAARPPVTLYLDPSDRFAAGHVPGARWLPRGWLELRVAEVAGDAGTRVVVTDEDGDDAVLGAATLMEMGYRDVAALAGGTDAWRREGRPLELGLTGVLRAPEDVVPAGPDRSYADMINYLRWEERLGHKYAPPESEVST
jgi:rhodanese-related sulfurtransferase